MEQSEPLDRETDTFLPQTAPRGLISHRSEPDVVPERCGSTSQSGAPLTKSGSLDVSMSESASLRGDGKRRLSHGDDPYWLPQYNDADEMGFLLGRVVRKDGAHKIRLTEVAPLHINLRGEEPKGWKMPVEVFSSKKVTNMKQLKSRRVRSYYKAQAELITAFEDIDQCQAEVEFHIAHKPDYKRAVLLSKITLFINLLLLIAKAVASALSGSMSIISSLVDSSLDLLSGIIMWWATRQIKNRDPYAYPQGRTKLEPVAVIILSVVMALASLQLVRESVEKIISLVAMDTTLPLVDAVTFAISGTTVVVKLILWLTCRRVRSPVVQALAQDHRNDVLSNTVAILCGYIGSRNFQEVNGGLYGFSYVDPSGAILISAYIVYNWWQTGAEQIRNLTGHTARPEFLSQLTWVCVNHHPKVRHIDTVRAFHFGQNYLVEVDIVLPADMVLQEAHDIGESLQHRLEGLTQVERAFVHLDYEFSHNPKSEHKIV